MTCCCRTAKGGKNSKAKPRARSTPAKAPKAKTALAERANSLSLRLPKQRVNKSIKQTRKQQHQTQSGQWHAKLTCVVVGQNHIQRQRHKSQRQTQQTIAPAVACIECGYVLALVVMCCMALIVTNFWPKSARRSLGSEVLGDNQIAKN